MNYNQGFIPGNMPPPTGQIGNQQNENIDRERRLKLREQERLRRNQGYGDEGLQYGASQIKPPD